jgi:hypothetical protein
MVGGFSGKILMKDANSLLSAAIRARDRYNLNGLRPSDSSIMDMAILVTEIKKRCESNLNSNRPTKIAETTIQICDKIFSVLSEINPSILDENLKGKIK